MEDSGRSRAIAAIDAAANTGGAALAAVFGALGRVRPTAKPLHPRGAVTGGTVLRSGGCRVGVPWLDDAGVDEVIVRLSRATGLPPRLPDFLGLALRVPVGPGRHGDLLFASTGHGALTRYLLAPSRDVRRTWFGTLLPYRTPAGPVVLACQATGTAEQLSFNLCAAVGRQPWRMFGELVLDADAAPDNAAAITFDPIRNTIPGLDPYDWVRRLREPPYRAARHSRGQNDTATG